MSLHCFSLRALEPEPAQAEFNAFCAQHRVVRVEKHVVADGEHSFWAVCVEVAEGQPPLPDALKRNAARRGEASGAGPAASAKPDYKNLLSEADFQVFVALRQWRKARAEADGVPLYAVFTNEQLAAIAEQRCTSLAALGSIEGVGAARVQRYGDAMLQCVASVSAGGVAPTRAGGDLPVGRQT